MQDPSSLYSQIKSQPQPQFPEQEHLKCPRCDSTNTKFCYYNNYNLSQPRHFCKSCRRYWTKGGALRNIPVGGGSRKHTKRSSSSGAAASKRPVPAATASNSNSNSRNDSKSNNGENPETIPLKGENFGGQFGNFLEASGSFSSLLGSSGGQFGNFLDGPALQITDHFGEPGPVQNVDPPVNHNTDGFLNMHGADESGNSNGDNHCWGGNSNGWPDLAMYTPGSSFQ